MFFSLFDFKISEKTYLVVWIHVGTSAVSVKPPSVLKLVCVPIQFHCCEREVFYCSPEIHIKDYRLQLGGHCYGW